jgi:hypothetical protein
MPPNVTHSIFLKSQPHCEVFGNPFCLNFSITFMWSLKVLQNTRPRQRPHIYVFFSKEKSLHKFRFSYFSLCRGLFYYVLVVVGNERLLPGSSQQTDTNQEDRDVSQVLSISGHEFYYVIIKSLVQWLRLALSKEPNWVRVFSPLSWGRKEI